MGTGGLTNFVRTGTFDGGRLQDVGVVFDGVAGTSHRFGTLWQHYRLPYDAAFDLCVDDLKRIAVKWHTTYEMVNLIIFIILYLILLCMNVLICLYLYSL